MAYLDNMFHGLPKSDELYRIKQDLLSGMEEKYTELKLEGKSEHEAIGIVISEFGNIDELLTELGLSTQSESNHPILPELHEVEVNEYLNLKRSNGLWIGLGVFFILLGVAFLISVTSLFEQFNLFTTNDGGSTVGLVGMFLLIAVAVSLFIYHGMKLQRFNYLEKGFKLNYVLESQIKHHKEAFAPTYKASVMIGVCILILSPIIIFTTNLINDAFAPYTVSVFLLTIACAVFIFIYYGSIQGAFTTLLRKQTVEHKKRG